MIGGAVAWGVGGTTSSCLAGFSFSGCRIACGSGVSSGGKAACTGCTFTGANSESGDTPGTPVAQPAKDAPKTPDNCLSAGQGYITNSSGVTTCVQPTTSPTPVEKVTTEKNSTQKPGETAPTESTTTTKTECDGANCTETTTTTDPTGTTTDKKTSDQETFCDKNPDSQLCKDAEDKCEENPDLVACKELGEPSDDSGELEKKAIGTNSITPASLGGSATCPADIPLPKGMSFSFQYICQYATGISPIVIILAWLSAGFLVLGFKD